MQIAHRYTADSAMKQQRPSHCKVVDETAPRNAPLYSLMVTPGGNKETGKIQRILPHLQTEEFPKNKTDKMLRLSLL